MKVNGLTRTLSCLLVLSGSGCEKTFRKIQPDRVGLGVTYRRIEGKYLGFRSGGVVPIWELRADKKLARHWDGYGRFQWNQQETDSVSGVWGGTVGGHFESIGIGVKYFPFDQRKIGLALGLEAFRAEYEILWWLGPIRVTRPDRFWGGGVSPGVIGEIPLTCAGRTQFLWEIGYHFTHAVARKTEVDLDGWYATATVVVSVN